jgi:uncharacterized protein
MIAKPRHLFDVTPTRWKNGLGTTRELLRVDASEGGGFALRVSVADVEADAAFSSYAGIDRTLAVLRGNGMRIVDTASGATLDTLLGPHQMSNFAGERPLEGRLIDGPILDFNVMTRRGVARAALRIVGPSQGRSCSSCRLLFVVRGSVRVADHDGNAAVLCAFEFFEPDREIQIFTSRDATAFVVETG